MKNLFLIIGLLVTQFLFAQNTEERELQNLVENLYQEIYTNLDSDKISSFFIDEAVIFDDGETFDNESFKTKIDSMKSQFDAETNNGHSFLRTNQFEFIESHIKEDIAWVSFKNSAEFTMDGILIAELNWLTSTILIKKDENWKVQLYHSSLIREKQ